jgi:lipopolysaccharide assembly outer membrane protein LptD (OstA)
VYIENDPNRATLRGTAQNPVRMEYTAPPKEAAAAQVTGAPAGSADAAPAPAPLPAPLPTKARAQKAVVEEESRQVTLTGHVFVDMQDREIQLEAENVVLHFGEDNAVTGFQARGDVVIVQPGRRLTSDSARSQNRMQTILLQGRAKAQQLGQFELNSDRMEVFTDPKKGSVRSEDRQRPINLSLDLAASKPYKLDAVKLQPLADKGVPPDTLRKLNPVLGRSYGKQDAFRKAVSDLLTQEESQRYMSLIIEQAH